MKYGYYFPEDFKNFMYKFGGDTQFGSCRFEYIDTITSNLLRSPGDMDFHLVPFGDVGNGDFYCFYRYGMKTDEYFIGIWLHETGNFVILTSNFKGFMYKCMLDDYLSTVIPNDELSEEECAMAYNESMERCKILVDEFGFDFEKVNKLKDEFDYHRLMAEYDEKAMQSLCYIGKNLLKRSNVEGFRFLDRAKEVFPLYTAPYYLSARALMNLGEDSRKMLLKAINTSLFMTGYSYWEEDYLEIPEDVHREITLYAEGYLKYFPGYLEKRLANGDDPYDYTLRLELANNYREKRNYERAMLEYSNSFFCCEDKDGLKSIMEDALICAKEAGMYYITGIIEHDMRAIR
jgi:hypothetical protein